MKIISRSDMQKICKKVYPNDKFNIALEKLIKKDDFKLVTTLTANNHYCVMEKLLKYLD